MDCMERDVFRGQSTKIVLSFNPKRKKETKLNKTKQNLRDICGITDQRSKSQKEVKGTTSYVSVGQGFSVITSFH